MVFSSAAFLFAFLPLVMGLYYLPVYRKSERRSIRYKNIILCASSLLFYAWGEPVYIVLMILSIVFNTFVNTLTECCEARYLKFNFEKL